MALIRKDDSPALFLACFKKQWPTNRLFMFIAPELSPGMKCSTVSASGVVKQVTSLQQLDAKIPKSQRRARNHVSERTAMNKNATSSYEENNIFILISASVL